MLKALLFFIVFPLAALFRWATDPAQAADEDTASEESDTPVATAAATIAPAPEATPVRTRKTTVNFVAHEDDDLLFLSPDIAADVQAGENVWVVYMTAGEVPPGNVEYANQRVEGERAAYARMARVANHWTSERVYFAGHELLSSTLNGTHVRLIFTYIHAEDAAHGDSYGDLWRMRRDESFEASPLDGRAAYTHDEFVDTLRDIIYAANPDLIRTQNSAFEEHDHIDHTSGAILAAEADTVDGATMIRRSEYYDYAIGGLDANWSGYWVNEKTAVWHTYVRYDRQVAPGGWDNVMNRQYLRETYMPGDPWVPSDDF